MKLFELLLFGLVLLVGSTSHALTLEQYMQAVKTKNKIFSALDSSKEAANDKLTAGDIGLSPVITAGYSLITDKTLPSMLGNRREIEEYSLGISKRFVTGTSLSLTGKTNEFENELAFPNDKYSTGGLGITLSQSLWRDFFGAGTRLRQEREQTLNQFETLRIELQIRLTTFEAESVFWDYAFAQEDLRLKKSNLERAQRLEKWTSNRVSNGISDRADLMNVKALAALREVQFATAQDEIKTQETKFREYMNLSDTEKTPAVDDDMIQSRNYVDQLTKNKSVVKIDLYLSSLEAKTKQLIANEIKDQSRPDLALVAGYNTSAYDRDYSEMSKNISKTDYPRTFIGLNFSWMFDSTAKSAQVSAATKDALSSKYIAERNLALGLNAWSDLIRKYETTKKNVTTLEKVALYQRERAKAEQDKFNKGRSVTFNVVTAETDAAEAEVNLLRAKAGLRKLEASSILYIAL